MTEKKRTSSSVHYDNEREGDSSEDEEIVSSRLSSELSKQQQLYTDLKRKTQQLKQLQQVTLDNNILYYRTLQQVTLDNNILYYTVFHETFNGLIIIIVI